MAKAPCAAYERDGKNVYVKHGRSPNPRQDEVCSNAALRTS